ncbi:MAG: zf-HC2 domain-containing protein [Clostridia bacterium]|nr:zf-HC2 domain-containing protein [Clostridia bacterium]
MKNECNIVRDLLPLYIENMTSEETREFVEAHLSKCPECNVLYNSMTDKSEELADGEEVKKKILPLKIVKQKLLCKRIVTSVVSVVVLLAVVIVAGAKAYDFVDRQNKVAHIDYGTSELYSRQEIMNVLNDKVLRQIHSFGFGYDIISVRYAGDEESAEAHRNNSGDYDAYMVFDVEIKTPAWAKPIWGLKPNTYYDNLKWHVAIDYDSELWVQSWDTPYAKPAE